MDEALMSYLETAFWSSHDPDGNDLDDKNFDDIDAESLKEQTEQLNDFLTKAADLIGEFDLKQVAHDFWLTRNGHGAGFWDGDYPKAIGEELTRISKTFGTVNVIIGDNGTIYFER